MTLLDEYQALPGEPPRPSPRFKCVEAMADCLALQVERRDAVIRLLCRALARYGHHDEDCVSENYPLPNNRCDCGLDALLTAVERDFPENSNG